MGLGSYILYFLILYTVGETPGTEDQLVARSLLIHRATRRDYTYTRTPRPRFGFESTIPLFQWAKLALDSGATVISTILLRHKVSLEFAKMN
jgi:hypothetical protein